MTEEPAVRVARAERAAALARLLGEQRNEEAVAVARDLLAGDPGDVNAMHLGGVALTRLGRAEEAVALLAKAVAMEASRAPLHLALGNALRRAGRHDTARQAFEAALARDAGLGAARYNLAEMLADEAAWREAARHLSLLVAVDPMDFAACQRLVDVVAQIARAPGDGDAPARTGRTRPAGRVTVGFCSIRPDREARARASFAKALAPLEVAFEVVRDARSLAEGFNRIVAATRTDHVILCHDDIEILSDEAGAVLMDGLAAADIVGVAGSSRACGPAVLWAGHPHLHGWVSYPREGAIEVAPLAFRPGLIPGMQALDGVLMAMRTETARRIGFDATTFDGFHFYDLDFTYRAHLAGLRLAVTTQLLVLHVSEGRFEADWQRYAQRFLAKYPRLDAPRGHPHWYGARLPDAAAAVRFYDELAALAAGSPTP